MTNFILKSEYELKGDQPEAVNKLTHGIQSGRKNQVLLGVTGSGKTFTMANVIARCNRPTLIMSPNKTLAGQLYNEFKELFPQNAVEFFVSYYDYYQPEAYIPATDSYIEKDAAINDRIDRLRHSATVSLLERNDVIVIASVSCIYGIGSKANYTEMALNVFVHQKISRDNFLRSLIQIQYQRNDIDFSRGTFRVRGENVDIFPVSSESKAIRIVFYDDEIADIFELDALLGNCMENRERVFIFPASHYVTPLTVIQRITKKIELDLTSHLSWLKQNNKLLEYQRLKQRTRYDLEMLRETGYCTGIENYSRYMDGRKQGAPPSVLIDFFPDEFLLFIDESHISIPQISGMSKGDHSRKRNLVDFGFRLPSAMDNRPLKFDEFLEKINNTIYVSATPAEFEIEKSKNAIVEQLIRPTGLIDPLVFVKPIHNQVDDLYEEIKKTILANERVLVTTLTKKMAEKLTEYYADKGIKVRYLHSDIDTLERLQIINDLREGLFSVLVGINLLREGLDIPEVSLVGILEADQEGFLRSKRSLIQIFGRASRNVNGKVILYADRMTQSIKGAMEETDRRREVQKAYNKKNHITPKTIVKSRKNLLLSIYDRDYGKSLINPGRKSRPLQKTSSLEKEIKKIKRRMLAAAKKYQFEEAAKLRDQMREYEKILNES